MSYFLLLNSGFDVGKAQAYSWDIQENVGAAQDYAWDIHGGVAAALDYSWGIWGFVSGALSYNWNILGSLKGGFVYEWEIATYFSTRRPAFRFNTEERTIEFTSSDHLVMTDYKKSRFR